jgi:rod shape-determining protein MreD
MNIPKNKIKRILTHFLLLFLLYILQTSVFTHIRLFGVFPLILPLAVVGIGLLEDGLNGGIWGIVAGLLCDISLADSGVLFTVSLAAIGFFTGFLSEFILARGFPTYSLLSLLVLAVLSFLQMFQYLIFDNVSFKILSRVALNQILYSALFIIPVYYPVKRVARKNRG